MRYLHPAIPKSLIKSSLSTEIEETINENILGNNMVCLEQYNDPLLFFPNGPIMNTINILFFFSLLKIIFLRLNS